MKVIGDDPLQPDWVSLRSGVDATARRTRFDRHCRLIAIVSDLLMFLVHSRYEAGEFKVIGGFNEKSYVCAKMSMEKTCVHNYHLRSRGLD